MIQLLSIVDGCDGEVARLKFMKSQWGTWLDPILDRYVDTAVIAGLSYGYWIVTNNIYILPLAIFMTFVMMMDDYMGNKFKSEIGRKLSFGGLKFKRDSRLLVLALGAVTNQIILSFLVFTVLSQYKVLVKLVAGKRITEEIKNTSSYALK